MGPTGAAGATGLDGAQGATGPTGPPGPTGSSFPSAYGYFTQSETLSIHALGGGIPFNGPSKHTAAFAQDDQVIYFLQDGVYYAVCTVILPANVTSINTQFHMHLNNKEIPGGAVAVQKTTAGTTYTAVLQAVFEATSLSVLRITSNQAFTVTNPSPTTSATLTLIKLQ